MNPSKVYSEAIGKSAEIEKTEEEIEKEFLKQTLTEEHISWVNLPQTVTFFEKLKKLEYEYFQRGRALLCKDFKSEAGIKFIIKSLTIRDIIDIYGNI